MKKIALLAWAALMLGACGHFSPAGKPCTSEACQKQGTWNACYGDGCTKAAGLEQH